MGNRVGEKWGWIGGWLGGFLWVPILAIVWWYQGHGLAGLLGLAAFAAAIAAVLLLAPWRHPTAAYWKLMVPLYLLLAICAAWALAMAPDAARYQTGGIGGWSLLGALPLLLPFFSIGRRRWRDGEGPAR